MLKKYILLSLMAASFVAYASQGSLSSLTNSNNNSFANVANADQHQTDPNSKAPQTIDLDTQIALKIDYLSKDEGFSQLKDLLYDLGKFFLNHEEPYTKLVVRKLPGVHAIRIDNGQKCLASHDIFALVPCSDSMFNFNHRKIVSTFLLNLHLSNDNIPKIIHGTKTDCYLISQYGKLTIKTCPTGDREYSKLIIQKNSAEKATQTTAPIMHEISTQVTTVEHKKQ